MRPVRGELSGRVVVVTRPRARAEDLARQLRARGARTIFAPLIKTLPPRSARALDAALRGFARFDAAAFASAAAVEAFFARARKVLGHAPRSPRAVGAVGPATRAALLARGWRAVSPRESTGAALARALRPGPGMRVLVPRAERARPELAEGLRRAGARVSAVTAYRTVPDAAGRRALKAALARGADAVVFASGSAAASAVAALGRERARRAFRTCAAVAIGPTTAAELRARAISPAALSRGTDAESLADAVVAALARRRP